MYSINRFLSHLNRLLKKKLSYEIFQIIEHITKPYYSPRFYSRKTESILYPLETFQNEQRDSKIQHHSTSKLRLEEKTVRKLSYSESSTKALFFFLFPQRCPPRGSPSCSRLMSLLRSSHLLCVFKLWILRYAINTASRILFQPPYTWLTSLENKHLREHQYATMNGQRKKILFRILIFFSRC